MSAAATSDSRSTSIIACDRSVIAYSPPSLARALADTFKQHSSTNSRMFAKSLKIDGSDVWSNGLKREQLQWTKMDGERG